MRLSRGLRRWALLAGIALVLVVNPVSAVAQPLGTQAAEPSRQDIYYIWREGSRLASGDNPYASILSSDSLENRKYATYLPLFYLLVAATHRLGLTDYHAWLAVWRPIVRVFHLGIALLLFVACRRAGRLVLGIFGALFWSLNRWTLYVTQVSQIDFIPVFLLLLSLLLLERRRRTSLLLLGTSLATKQLAVFLVPLYLIWAWRSSTRPSRAARILETLKTAAWIGVIPAAVSLPFLLWNANAFVSSVAFSAARAATSHVAARSVDVLAGLVGVPARLPMLILMCLVLVAAARGQIERYLSVLLVFAVFVDFNSVLFLQYMAWVAPFFVLAACEASARTPRLSG